MLKENKENEKKAAGSATGSAAMETSSSKGHGGNIKEQPGSPDETPPTDELVLRPRLQCQELCRVECSTSVY